jgi:hypothetical protein
MTGGNRRSFWAPRGPLTVRIRCAVGAFMGSVGDMDVVGKSNVTDGGRGMGSFPMWE